MLLRKIQSRLLINTLKPMFPVSFMQAPKPKEPANQQISVKSDKEILEEQLKAQKENYQEEFKRVNLHKQNKPSIPLDGLTEEQQALIETQQEEIILQQQKHKDLSTEVEKELSFPFKLYGCLNIPEEKTSYIADRIFIQSKLPKSQVLNHLYKIYLGSLHAMVDQDEEFLGEYLENGFCKRLVEQIKTYKEKGYTFKIYEDLSGIEGEPVIKRLTIIEMAVIRGLSVQRDQNLSEEQYHKYVDIEDIGLVIYTPLSLTEPENFVDPKTNKTIYNAYRKALMRLLLKVKTPIRLKVFKPDGEEIPIDDNYYTWEHLALFETQMYPPETFKSFYKSENYMEWLVKFKLGKWQMVDLDNWMLGNPLILNQKDRKHYTDEIFKGSKFDFEHNIDIKRV